MPPKKKGAKKGAKGIILIEFYLLNLGQADEDEYQEVPQVET